MGQDFNATIANDVDPNAHTLGRGPYPFDGSSVLVRNISVLGSKGFTAGAGLKW